MPKLNGKQVTSEHGLPLIPVSLHATFATNPNLLQQLGWPSSNQVTSTSQSPARRHPSSLTGRRRAKKDEEPASPDQGKDAVSRDKVFTCTVCQRSFGYKHVLQNHERTHTGEKPFECQECHKRFTRDHHLKTHMRLHTGEKPYHCNHCSRDFVQVANLRRHLRVHTGERPYSCKTCASKFSDSNQLKAHELIHKGEKPFGCTKCQNRFRRRHHLNHHKCPHDPGSNSTAGINGTESEQKKEDDCDSESEELVLITNNNEDKLYKTQTIGTSAVSPPNTLRVGRKPHPQEIRHLIRLPPPPMTPPITVMSQLANLPEQTEPEDLSMSSYRNLHSSGESSLSRSPSSEGDDPRLYEELEDTSSTYLKHPKFRRAFTS